MLFRQYHLSPRPHRRASGFTIVEALISLTVLGIFAVTSTATLNFFETRSARNRNSEAARAIVDDYVNYLLNDNIAAPTATADGTDLDGDGVPDGVPLTVLGSHTLANGIVPMVVTRTASPTTIVNGTLYWRVQPVGNAFGATNNPDIMQVNFMLTYVYRGQTFYYKVLTYKAKT